MKTRILKLGVFGGIALAFCTASSLAAAIPFLAASPAECQEGGRKTLKPVVPPPVKDSTVSMRAFPLLPKDFDKDFQLFPQASLSGRIVFSALINGFERILELDLDAKKIRVLVDGPGNNTTPAWSPNGKALVFVSDRDGANDLYLSDWDGLNQTRLTTGGMKAARPSFLGDKKQVVFELEESAETTNIYALDLASLERRPLTRFSGKNISAQSSPDGTRVVYATNRFWPGWDICEWDLEGRQEHCLLKGDISYSRPAYSRNGALLSYAVGQGEHIDLGLYSFTDKTDTKLTDMELREYESSFSPSSDFLVFCGEGETKDIFNLYLVEIKTKKITPLLKAPYSLRYVSWSPVTTLELEASRFRKQESAPSGGVLKEQIDASHTQSKSEEPEQNGE